MVKEKEIISFDAKMAILKNAIDELIVEFGKSIGLIKILDIINNIRNGKEKKHGN